MWKNTKQRSSFGSRYDVDFRLLCIFPPLTLFQLWAGRSRLRLSPQARESCSIAMAAEGASVGEAVGVGTPLALSLRAVTDLGGANVEGAALSGAGTMDTSIHGTGVATSLPLMPNVVTDPNDPVVQLIAKLDKGEMGLVQTADCIEAALHKAGMVYTMDIAPRMVGLDPINRDGEGGNAQQVLMLAADIFDVGFSWEATRHATCVEIIPGTKTVEVFNR